MGAKILIQEKQEANKKIRKNESFGYLPRDNALNTVTFLNQQLPVLLSYSIHKITTVLQYRKTKGVEIGGKLSGQKNVLLIQIRKDSSYLIN